ncbi:Diacylglycerol O-acyltransferase [Bertholletia excelsa]
MEASGIVLQQLPSLSGIRADCNLQSSRRSSALGLYVDGGNRFACGDSRLSGAPRWRIRKYHGFSKSGFMFTDNGHLEYYYGLTRPAINCGCGKEDKVMEKEMVKKAKKRLKLLKCVCRDLSKLSEMGFGLDPQKHALIDQVRGSMISEATELLLGQLEQLRAEEKEMKREREDKKAWPRAAQLQNKYLMEESSSTSSECSIDSDGECGKVVDMSCLKSEQVLLPSTPEVNEPLPQPMNMMPDATLPLPLGGTESEEGKNSIDAGTQEAAEATLSLTAPSTGKKRIEVCMGGKCKKSGGGLLLEEFKRVLGAEAEAVGCKCMGKCRDGPNVRVVNCSSNAQDVLDDSVRTPTNPVCIGVGLEDVGLIVANFLGETHHEVVSLAPSS